LLHDCFGNDFYLLLGNAEEGQRWAEIQAETIEADES